LANTLAYYFEKCLQHRALNFTQNRRQSEEYFWVLPIPGRGRYSRVDEASVEEDGATEGGASGDTIPEDAFTAAEM